MKINLKEIPLYWINLEKDKYKKYFQEKQFLEYDLAKNYRIDAVELANSINSSKNGNAYLSQLISLYKIRNKLPALILEDDATIIKEHFKYDIEVPNDTDVLYLGHSIWGMAKDGKNYPALYDERPYVRPGVSVEKSMGATVHTKYNNELVRTHNMMATHAAVYISKEYVDDLISNLEKYIFKHKVVVDMITAIMQQHYKALATKKPFFYQKNFSEKKDHIEYYTLNPKINDGYIDIKDKY